MLRDVLNTENIIKVSPDDTLSHALAKLSSSHDAAFVFSPQGELLGVINPYHCLIRSSYPGNAKVEHCLFHPPRILVDDSYERIAQLMSESKIHYLPVFDKENVFLGIISANRLLGSMPNKSVFRVRINDILKQKGKPLIKIHDTDPVSHALNLYKEHKISKLVVVGKDEKLRGILSYYDLIYFLISPKEKLHQGEREGNKIGFYNQPVRNFAKNHVLTLSKSDSMAKALEMIFEKKIGSVVIIDENRYPLQIITKRDFFQLAAKPKEQKMLQITYKNLTEQSKKIVVPFIQYSTQLITKIPGVSHAKVIVKEEKQGGVFKIVLSLIPYQGTVTIIQREGKNLQILLKDVMQKLLGSGK